MRVLAFLVYGGMCVWCSTSSDPVRVFLDRSIELQREGKPAEAERILRIAVRQAQQSGNTEEMGLALSYLGSLYTLRGRFDKARASLSRAIHIWIALGDEPNPRLIQTARDLIAIYMQSGDAASAARCWTKILRPMLGRVNADTIEFAGLLEQQGMVYLVGKQYSKAEPLLTQAIAIRCGNEESNSEELAIVLNNRAAMRIVTRRYEEALSDLTRALAILAKTGIAEDLSTAEVLANIGVACSESHRQAQADLRFSHALSILGHLPESRGEAGILKSYAIVLRKSGRKREARQMELRANTIMERFAREPHQQSIDASELALGLKP